MKPVDIFSLQQEAFFHQLQAVRIEMVEAEFQLWLELREPPPPAWLSSLGLKIVYEDGTVTRHQLTWSTVDESPARAQCRPSEVDLQRCGENESFPPIAKLVFTRGDAERALPNTSSAQAFLARNNNEEGDALLKIALAFDR